MPKKSRSIIVTVTDEKLEEIQKVAEDLKNKGMKVDRVLPITGVISGSYTAKEIKDLEKIEGVMSVEESLTAELPPTDSPTQ